MKAVRDSLLAAEHRDRILVERLAADGTTAETYTYDHIARWAAALHRCLSEPGSPYATPSGARIGLVAGNGPEWVAADLALLLGGLVEVPVPLAFSAEQAGSLLREVHLCLADEAGAHKLHEWGLAEALTIIPIGEHAGGAHADPQLLPAPSDERIIKIIHTSGTTGTPKGVKIRAGALGALLESLHSVSPPGVYARYLSLVPFSLLIEQVTAVYLPLLSGGRMVLLPDTAALLGTAGSRADDVVAWLRAARPTAAVLPPAAVSALDKAVREPGADADALLGAGQRPFLMAGGAPVDVEAQLRLDAAGLRVHEGYGLSENSSVVSWNTPEHWRPGTVGRPLPHCRVKLSAEGELLVTSTSLFAGYTVEDPTSRPVDAEGWLHTGDRAEIDEDGYIRILGRLKNVIITSHGRNVSPEWVEGNLRSCSAVVDAVVFGEGMEHLVAVLVTPDDVAAETAREQARAYAEAHLAETDRPEMFVVVQDGRAFRDRYFTVTGRPRRQLIYDDFVPGAVPAPGGGARLTAARG
ncbi:AMP-binding protein [Streptomyces sp. NPDC018029]|uniref:AMP-binding protein n=1 Tax=Streptomyces sp. NPDC018029 TaxID=3365032 RepID=UPI0037B13008